MRLTIINQFYTPDISPTAHLAASLAEHRVKRRDEVRVIASAGGYVPQSGAAAPSMFDNPRIHRLWTPRLGKATKLKRCIDYAAFYAQAALTALTIPRQDVIIALTTPPFIAWTAVLHKFLHPWTRIILWNMDCYPEAAERTGVLSEKGRASRIMRWFNRLLFRRLDHLVALDTAMLDLLVSQYAPPSKSLAATVIPNWEPAALFPRRRGAERWSQAEPLGLSDRFVVLYLGNTGYGHQFETVLDAAELLRDENVTFLFVGGGSRWESIRQEAQRRGLHNILLHDYVPKDQTPVVMAGADCALITLRDVVLGVMSPSKLHANLAAGLPILYVGPRGSNVDDAITRFECGVSLRHGDAAGVAGFIRALKSDRARHEALRRRAREAFEAAYCDARALRLFDEVIDRVSGAADSAERTDAETRGPTLRLADGDEGEAPRAGSEVA